MRKFAVPILLVLLLPCSRSTKVEGAEKPVSNVQSVGTNFGQIIAYSPDGKFLAIGRQSIEVWNVETGALAAKFRQDRFSWDGRTNGLEFTPDGKMLISGHEDGTIGFWSVPEGKLIHEKYINWLRIDEDSKLPRGPLPVRALEISPTGKYLVTALYDGSVQLWEIRSRKFVRNFEGGLLPQRADSTAEAAMDPSRQRRRIEFPATSSSLFPRIAFSSNEEMIAVSGIRSAVIWNTLSGERINSLKTGGQVCFLNDKDDLLTVTYGEGKVWETNNFTMKQKIPCEKDLFPTTISPDRRLLATCSSKPGVARLFDIRLWNLSEGTVVASFQVEGEAIDDLCFSPDGKNLAVCKRIENVDIYRLDLK